MARGKYLSLEEARREGKLARFAKEHPAQGDADRFERLLSAMASGKPPAKSGNINSGCFRKFQRNSISPRYFGRCLGDTQICVPAIVRFTIAQKASMVFV